MPSFVSAWVIGPIVFISMLGVLTRWCAWSETRWAVFGALALILTGQVSLGQTAQAIWKGHDIYLFLLGMMLIAELAQRTGVFDWLACRAVNSAKGSSLRLFMYIYGVGLIVTTFLSNDATAVVLTPAVIAATRAAKVHNPLPHLYACALVANAASFILPISNPANLVVFADGLPDLYQWIRLFALPSLAAVIFTCLALIVHQHRYLKQPFDARPLPVPSLSTSARITLCGMGAMVTGLLAASASSFALGLPAFVLACVTACATEFRHKGIACHSARSISWSALPLVAGLFVLIEGLNNAGLTTLLGTWFEVLLNQSTTAAIWLSGLSTGLVSNAVNNLPAGLFAGSLLVSAQAPEAVRAATLIGINLGPNLSVTGSLATLLWLVALRREGMNVTALQFLKMGAFTLPLALVSSVLMVAWFN